MTREERRFWNSFDERDPEKCWAWKRNLRKGYGRFYANGRLHSAHRWSYELLIGPIPAGLTIDHLCRNRSCVNPAHLEPVTVQVNVARAPHPQRQKAECPHGHTYEHPNVWIDKRGYRYCRECMRTRSLERYRANIERERKRAREYQRRVKSLRLAVQQTTTSRSSSS